MRAPGVTGLARVVGRVGRASAVAGDAPEPLGDAVVTLVDRHGRQHGRARAVDGHYELVLPGPGAWQVIVAAPGHAPRADRLVVRGCPRTRGHDVTHDVVLV